MHLLVRVFLCAWFAGLGIMAVVFPTAALFGKFKDSEPPLIFLVGPLLMILFGVGLVSFGRWIARGQVSRLHEFLRVDLEAAPEGNTGLNEAVQRTEASRSPQQTIPASGESRSGRGFMLSP
jgi:hypothetical protein